MNDGRLLYCKTKPYLRGDDVKVVQEALKKAGFDPGISDGIFGPRTARAVTAYQKTMKIKADGIVGPQTWGLLFAPTPAEEKRNLRLNDSGDDVKLLQKLLCHFGFNCGAEDGRFGGKTDAAVRTFQRKMGLLTGIGIVGPRTWGALQAPSLERFKLWGFLVLMHERDYTFMVKEFQAAMSIKKDGKVGAVTLGKLIEEPIVPRFAEEDMRCQCPGYCSGFPAGHVSIGIRVLAERVMRETEKQISGVQYYIPSRVNKHINSALAGGYRCAKWNKERGGASGSRHLKGLAMDIGVLNAAGNHNSAMRLAFEKNWLNMNTQGGVGHSASKIVHGDTDGKRRWAY